MKTRILFLIILWPFAAFAGGMTLDQYLESVKTGNPDARSAVDSVAAFTGRQRESQLMYATNLYGTYSLTDNRAPQLIPAFQGTDTRVSEFKVGLRKQTDFGLGVDVNYDGNRTAVSGISDQLLMGNSPDSYVAAGTLALNMSFWKNGFGEGTRADEAALDAKNKGDLLKAQYQLKSILLNAENSYWTVVSFNEIIRLQQENLDRAKKLQDYMSKRRRERLVDDTDAIQADAAYESRGLELQSSLDDRAVAVRDLNTLRGTDNDQIGELGEWPGENMMSETKEDPRGHMSREDFEMLRAQAKGMRAQAKSSKSNLDPQLDLKLAGATNGRDGVARNAIADSGTLLYPMWSIGVSFSMPLDFGLISDVRKGYLAAETAADQMDANADFTETRVWNDLVRKTREAQGRYQRSLKVERIQADLVKRERVRLLNGRATTFESLSFEQNLALAQIQRVRAQLVLLTLHNTLKTFEVK